MNPWWFIAGAYAVSALAIIVEILALRWRQRAALASLHEGGEIAGEIADPPRERPLRTTHS
jgi:hypothetical protein